VVVFVVGKGRVRERERSTGKSRAILPEGPGRGNRGRYVHALDVSRKRVQKYQIFGPIASLRPPVTSDLVIESLVAIPHRAILDRGYRADGKSCVRGDRQFPYALGSS
jgi:hypothetical protein